MDFQIVFQQNGKLHPVSKEILIEKLQVAFSSGKVWNVRLQKASYTSTRYKYLFAYVYPEALKHISDTIHVFDGYENGSVTTRPVETPQELHDYLKALFAKVSYVDATTGDIKEIVVSTTTFEDPQFYRQFENSVILYLSEIGAFPDGICGRDEWAEKYKALKRGFSDSIKI